MKKILILGGTQFVGRNIVERLEQLGNFEITLFNRQQTKSDLFPNLNHIKGDRETDDINQLKNKKWDIVIDSSAYYPKSLSKLLNILKGNIEKYIFISTISVYDLEEGFSGMIKENSPLVGCTLLQSKDTSLATYGNRKAACEEVILTKNSIDTLILRPSLIYGKYDPTDRLYYWLYKSTKQNPFILPNNGKDKITLTYINDLVNIIIQSFEIERHATIYNATTHSPFSLKEMVNCINKNAKTVNIDSNVLLENEITPGKDIPLWFDMDLEIDNSQLLLDFRPKLTPFEQSVAETQNYYEQLKWPFPKAGINEVKEREIIKIAQ
jgi:2'-hydroxyisoflavone reductase